MLLPTREQLSLDELDRLQALVENNEPPTDSEEVAILLRRWMPIGLKDKPIAKFKCHQNCLGFLEWLLREVGKEPYLRIKQTHPEDAAEIRRQILTLAFWATNYFPRIRGPKMARDMALEVAEAARVFPEFAMGAEDAKF